MELLYPKPESELLWTPVGEPEVLASGHNIQLVSQKYRSPEGNIDDYDYCSKKPGLTLVCVLKDGRIVVGLQFKQGIGEVVGEFPAGFMQNDVSEIETAAKIAKSFGIMAQAFIPLFEDTFFAPRKVKTRERLMLALGCELTLPEKAPDKYVNIFAASVEEVFGMIKKGEMSGFSEMAIMRALFLKHIQLSPDAYERLCAQ